MLNKGRKVAKKIYDDFLQEKDTVKASDACQVLKMQHDRFDPAVKVQKSLNMNMTFTRIDLSKYRNDTIPDVVEEAEFENVDNLETTEVVDNKEYIMKFNIITVIGHTFLKSYLKSIACYHTIRVYKA